LIFLLLHNFHIKIMFAVFFVLRQKLVSQA
jgi:hypothetical protein